MDFAGFLKNAQILDTCIIEENPNKYISSQKEEYFIHHYYRLIIGLEGERVYNRFEKQGITNEIVTPGKVYFISPEAFFEPNPEFACEASLLSIIFYPEYIRLILLKVQRTGEVTRECTRHCTHALDRFTNDFLTLLECSKSVAGATRKLLFEALLRFIGNAVSNNPEYVTPRTSSVLWKDMNRYLVEHINISVSRKELAAMFKITPNYVSNLFKRFSGTSFSNVYKSYRLKYATNLLLNTKLSVKEISAMCGYNYCNFFIRRFKEKYSMTPADFRRKNQRQIVMNRETYSNELEFE